MKNIIVKINLFFLVLIVVSCSKSPSELLIGEWKVSDIQTTEEIPAGSEEIHQKAMDEFKATTLLVFNADSTFAYTISESTQNGKWKVSEDSKKLSMNYDDSGEETSNINELTDKTLSVTIDASDYKRTIVFEKQIKQ